MAYIFDPYQFRYVYYPDGTTPPNVSPQGQEYIPGFTQDYVNTFPNQPYSQQYNNSSVGATNNVSTPGGIRTINGQQYTYQNGRWTPYSGSNSSGTGSTGTGNNNQNTAQQRDAYEFLRRMFGSYGLDSLAPKILEYLQQGYGSDTISLMLQDTPEYKQRFKANDSRRQQGLPVLSPAEYIELERSYRQILDQYGLPKGFYDSQDDFAGWIGGDVSPVEIQQRASIAAGAVNNSDNEYLQSLREYGLGEGDLVAAILDRKRALPVLEKTVREAQIGAEARRNGMRLSESRAGYFESLGVDRDEARGAYQFMGEYLGTLTKLGQIYDESYKQEDAEDELLGGSGLASQKRKRLQSREKGNFSGSSAIGSKTFAGPSRGEI